MYSCGKIAENIQVLISSTNTEERTRADEYLTQFMWAFEAWDICKTLVVCDSNDIVVTMTAQILYRKIANEWGGLSESHQEELRDFLYEVRILKLARCVAFVGVLSMNSHWESFIEDVLRLESAEVVLGIIECVPHCLLEECMGNRYRELIKTKLREKAMGILDRFDRIISEFGCVERVIVVLKNLDVIGMPILSHSALYLKLASAFAQGGDMYCNLCDAYINTLVKASYGNLLQQEKYFPGKNYFLLVPEPDRHNLSRLISSLFSVTLSELSDEEARKTAELVVCVCSNYMFVLLDAHYGKKMWDTIRTLIRSSDLVVSHTVCEFIYEMKNVFTRQLNHLENVEFLLELLGLVESLAEKCVYQSYEHYFESLSQDSNFSFSEYRNYAEDYFQSIFFIFVQHDTQGGHSLLSHISQLISDRNEFKCEVFVFIVRSIVPALIEVSSSDLLHTVIDIVLQLPLVPLVLKGALSLFTDVSPALATAPAVFQRVLEYTLQYGFAQFNSALRIEATAVECFRLLSYDCYSLFNSQLIFASLGIYETVLSSLESSNAAIFIEGLLKTFSELTEEEIATAVTRVVSAIETDCASSFPRYIELWSSVLSSLEPSESPPLFHEPLSKAVFAVNSALSGLSSNEPVLQLISSFYKKLFKGLGIHADHYSQCILNTILVCSSTIRLLSVVVQAISSLGCEPHTYSWVSEHYSELITALCKVQFGPETAAFVFEIALKVLSCGHPAFNELMCISQLFDLGLSYLKVLRSRDPVKSILGLFQSIYAQKEPTWSPLLCVYSEKITGTLIPSLLNMDRGCHQYVAWLLGLLRTQFYANYFNGILLALESPEFSLLPAPSKGRVLSCFLNVETSPIFQLKELLWAVSRILSRTTPVDALTQVELSIQKHQLSNAEGD